jgi:ribosome recycling factor
MANLNQFYEEIKLKMVKPIINLENELKKIRGGRVSTGLVENIKVELADGKILPIQSISTISLQDARTIVISPWDKANLSAIEKAIQKENININPVNDGKIIRLSFPQMTEETRKDLVKSIKNLGEEAKVAIRNIRRDFLEKIKDMEKKDEIIEDEKDEAEEKLQEFTNKAIAKIDKIIEEKEKEIMTI